MINKTDNKNYTTITEIPNGKASREQLTSLYTRYRFASEYCGGGDVLEVACGAGLGIGYLARYARKVTGGDIDENNLRFAHNTYTGKRNIKIRSLDAHDLPFANESFDTVLLFEAIYYLAYPERFMSEAFRVLRKGGSLLICTANKDWTGFNPSTYSFTYFSAPELYSLINRNGFDNITLYGASPVIREKSRDKIVSSIRKTAVALHLIPETMKGKEFLKRIFMGRLVPLPREIDDGMAAYSPPVPVPSHINVRDYKVIYALATK